jgi:hypothetical protein
MSSTLTVISLLQYSFLLVLFDYSFILEAWDDLVVFHVYEWRERNLLLLHIQIACSVEGRWAGCCLRLRHPTHKINDIRLLRSWQRLGILKIRSRERLCTWPMVNTQLKSAILIRSGAEFAPVAMPIWLLSRAGSTVKPGGHDRSSGPWAGQ